MKIDLGGGTIPKEGYVNVDPEHGEYPYRMHWGTEPLPFPDGTVEAARASHVLEHIRAGRPRIFAMNDVWRVLKPGGLFEIIVPCVGYTDHPNGGAPVMAGWQAWADPTHTSYWFFPESFWYFTGRFAANADYGVSIWEEVSMELEGGWEAHVTLRRPA